MTQYDQMSEIIKFSLDELDVISRYLHENEEIDDPTTVLIGGWAVNSYNPWFGSIDIDLITNNNTRKSLRHHLRINRDFKPYRGRPLIKFRHFTYTSHLNSKKTFSSEKLKITIKPIT